ncbi:MAG: hypothetical protein JST01_17740 [Cyanobacteria bacterium SZAS TMP-1]|nr:hypothetical protein [Cyanobacteria bacterium SZAS TMP-1]
MGALGNNLATWLTACAFFVWAFDFVKGKGYLNLDVPNLKKQGPVFIGLLLGVGALFGLSHLLGLAFAASIVYFAIGAVACCLVSSLNFENKSRSLLLLGITGLAYLLMDSSGQVPYVAGLLAWKICSNFLNPEKATLSDVAPAALFMAGQICVGTSYSGTALARSRDLICCSFIASALVNWFQRPFRADDAFLLKRLILTATGGLIFLILVTKVVLAQQYAPMAVLVAAGFAFNYALDGQGVKPGTSADPTALELVRNVLIIGILTLVSTRLYGNLGLIVVAAPAAISFFSQAPAIAALFVAARSLEQAFDVNYVANVTGINLMHPYVTAAQYFAFFTILVLLLLLKEGRDNKFVTVAMTAVAVVGPALVNYFLHGEASASYMVGLTVAGVLVSILGQRFFQEQEALCGSLMLIAAQASAVGLLTAELVEFGNSTAGPERLKVVYVLAAITAIAMIASLLRTKLAKPVSQ